MGPVRPEDPRLDVSLSIGRASDASVADIQEPGRLVELPAEEFRVTEPHVTDLQARRLTDERTFLLQFAHAPLFALR
jgi:hypothetical protein